MKKPNVLLLTHERELSKSTNTAQCAIASLPDRARQIVWQRKSPDPDLLDIIRLGRVGLVYPAEEDDVATTTVSGYDNWLILDGTWQEARKMYNRSPYLHNLPRIKLTPVAPSQYVLRRNQKPDGLSTAECIAQLLKDNDEADLSELVMTEFVQFNSRAKERSHDL